MTNPEQIKNLFERLEAVERIQSRHSALLRQQSRQIENTLELIGRMDLDRTQKQQLVRAIRGSEE